MIASINGKDDHLYPGDTKKRLAEARHVPASQRRSSSKACTFFGRQGPKEDSSFGMMAALVPTGLTYCCSSDAVVG